MPSDVDEFLAGLERIASTPLSHHIAAAAVQRAASMPLAATAAAGAALRDASNRPRRRHKRARDAAAHSSAAAVELDGGDDAAAAAPRTPPPAASAAPAQWACLACTLLNPLSAAHCDACEAPQPVAAVASPPPPDVELIDDFGNPTAAAATAAADDDDDDDDEEDDDDEATTADSESPSAAAAVREVLDDAHDDAALADLPLAAPPASMAGRGCLLAHQLQALHWMLAREGELPADTSAAAAVMTAEASAEARRVAARGYVPELDDFERPQRGGVLADYMGLGKTRTLIALCEAARGAARHKLVAGRTRSSATLIVCPMILISQWAREIRAVVGPGSGDGDDDDDDDEASSKGPRILRYYGKARLQCGLFQIAQRFDYVLTSYQTLVREPLLDNGGGSGGNGGPGKLFMIHWHRVILDEAHTIRNPGASQSKACQGLVADRRWAVTGTPMQNRLGDLFELFRFLRVPRFRDAQWWTQNIAAPLAANDDDERVLGRLRRLLAATMLRRLPMTRARDGRPLLPLPPKTVHLVHVDLSAEERDFYSAVHDNAKLKLDTLLRRDTSLSGAYTTAFEMLLRCRQAALHPFLVVTAVQHKRVAEARRLGLERGGTGVVDEAALAAADVAAQVQGFVQQLRRRLDCAPHFAADVLRDVESQALASKECTICLDQVTRPAVLPCGHVFCCGCIHRALASGDAPRCPNCKRATAPAEVVLVPEVAVAAPGSGPTLHDVDTSDTATWMASSKVLVLLGLIAAVPAEERIVVFSVFASFLRYVQKSLTQRGVTSALLTGELSARQRDVILADFGSAAAARRSAAAPPRVLLATITACGVGINLTRASRCFILDPSWNPGVEEQAMNRLHRIGQARPVSVVRLIARDTVEDNIDRMCETRRELCARLLRDPSATLGARAPRLTVNEIFALLRGAR